MRHVESLKLDSTISKDFGKVRTILNLVSDEGAIQLEYAKWQHKTQIYNGNTITTKGTNKPNNSHWDQRMLQLLL